MTAKEVLNTLKITRNTLSNYVKNNKIKTTQLKNGRYEYDEGSVNMLLDKKKLKETYVYLSSSYEDFRQYKLHEKLNKIDYYCNTYKHCVDKSVYDIRSSESAERTIFNKIVKEIMRNKIGTLIIYERNDISNTDFNIFKYIFKKYGCDIIIVSEVE